MCTVFTINSECSFPLYTLLADATETCGGSKILVRMFNRLSTCCSPETALWYVQYHVQKRTEEGIMAVYPCDCFMIASADNIDYIHHYIRVYCGKQQLSWHGTTVQIAQPKPCTLTTDIREGEVSLPTPDSLSSHRLNTNKEALLFEVTNESQLPLVPKK